MKTAISVIMNVAPRPWVGRLPVRFCFFTKIIFKLIIDISMYKTILEVKYFIKRMIYQILKFFKRIVCFIWRPYLRVWMGLTDNWQMAKILTDNWQIDENLTDYWHLPWVLLTTDKGPDCPALVSTPVFKTLNSIVPLFSSDNVIKCAFLI